MLSQHLDKARQDTRTLREAQATWQGGAVVTGRPPLPGLAPSAAVPVPAAAAQAVVGMGSLWGSLASPGSSGVGAAARHGWHLQQEQRGELQRMEGELAAAAAQQGGAEQPTEGSASNSGDQRSTRSHAHLPMPVHFLNLGCACPAQLLWAVPRNAATPAPGCMERPSWCASSAMCLVLVNPAGLMGSDRVPHCRTCGDAPAGGGCQHAAPAGCGYLSAAACCWPGGPTCSAQPAAAVHPASGLCCSCKCTTRLFRGWPVSGLAGGSKR